MKKKYIIVLALVIMFMSQAYGQHIRFGVFANPGVSWLKSNNSRIETNGDRLGFNFGLMLDNFFAPHYAFSTGISIHNLGGSLLYHNEKSLSTSDGDFALNPISQVTYKLQYIHIPLALKFQTVQVGYTTYFAQLGFDPMFNVNANASFTDKTGAHITDTGVGDEINALYLAYHLSAGVEYQLVGNTMFMGGITFMNGFTNVTNDGSAKTVLNCFELRLGVFF